MLYVAPMNRFRLAWRTAALGTIGLGLVASWPYAHSAIEIGRIPTVESGNTIVFDLACNPDGEGLTTFDADGDVIHVHCPVNNLGQQHEITCAIIRHPINSYSAQLNYLC